MLEERLSEIDSDLKSLNAQVELAKKEKSQISPGLRQAIETLLKKQETMITSLELWKTMQKVYPNYDR
jgi:hypothetical protein